MSDEVTPEDTAQAQGTEPAKAADGPKYVTADDLKGFRDGLFADVRKVIEGATKPRNGKAQVAAESQEAPEGGYQAAIRREREISEAFEDVGGLTREGRAVLRKLVDAEKPDNVNEYIAAHAKAFTRAPDPTKQTTARPLAATDRPPVSDAGSPAAPATFTEDTPLWQLKQEDRDHLIRKHGHGWYANTLRKQLKGVRVKVR